MSKEKLSRILGLRLLAIKEGADCGEIREVVLDVEAKSVKYLVLDTGRGCFGFRVLPNEKISGMGRDFAITSSSEFVSDIWTNQEAIALSYTDSDLIGARVVSDLGDVIGKIVDFEFELAEGSITSYIMENGSVLPFESIVTLSRGIVFVDIEKLDQAVVAQAEVASAAVQAAPMLKAVGSAPVSIPVASVPEAAPVAVPEKPAAAPAPVARPVAAAPVQAAAPVVPAPAAAPVQAQAPAAPAGENNADMKSYFEKRRTEFLIGKSVKQNITDNDGTVLAKVGDTVDADMIERIKAADKIIELTMGVN